eukprot:11191914-Lingulodinium_polyedra.AAC.1
MCGCPTGCHHPAATFGRASTATMCLSCSLVSGRGPSRARRGARESGCYGAQRAHASAGTELRPEKRV